MHTRKLWIGVSGLVVACALAALLWLRLAPEPPPPEARVAFVGVWEGAVPGLRAAAERQGAPVDLLSVAELNARSPAALARYDAVLVLNIDAELAAAMARQLAAARALKPEQRVIALDRRDSQAALEKAELLTRDDEVQRYWRYGGVRNYQGLLSFLHADYRGASGVVQPPELMPQDGLYHPDHGEIFADAASFRGWYAARPGHRADAQWVVFLVHQRFIILEDTAMIDAVVRALERRGINVATVFASDEARGQALITACEPAAIITQRHTPMGRRADGTPLLPAQLDVPYLKPIAMLGQTVEEWAASPQGLAPRDLGLQVVMQELDGAIETLVIGGLVAQTGGYSLQAPIPDRVERFADRVVAQLRLRTLPAAEKRVAVIYYNKYLGRSDLGRGTPSGAFLNGPRSLVATLAAMQRAGYTIAGAPQSEDELLARMQAEGRNLGVWAQGEIAALVRDHDPVLIPVATYERWFVEKLSRENQRKVIAAFGPPPGELMTHERDGERFLVIPRIDLGNVILAPQPDRGPNQDEDLVHNTSIPPPHQYLAFYWWLQEEWKADAIVHFGTHSSTELLPTKATGLSREDWPDIAVGAMPLVYPWILDNLAEAMLAKRRSYATLIGHLVPPIAMVGLAREMKSIHDDIDRFETLEPGLLREEYRASISRQAVEVDLHVDIAPEAKERPFTDAEIEALSEYLHRAHNEHTPVTLHVFGQAPERALLAPYVAQIAGNELLEHLEPETPPLPAGDARTPARRKAELLRRAEALLQKIVVAGQTDAEALGHAPGPALAEDLARARDILAKLERTPVEIESFLRGLAGRYILPGPGNDPVRNPSALPTGRNLYALNPGEIPTRPAWEAGRKLVDQLLARSREQDGRYPRKVGFDLNGFETMRNFGVDEAQLLYFPGCRPIWDDNRNVVDVELIARAELGRPRIDVFVAASGAYRDNFPTRMLLIDKCVRLAADDPDPVDNYVREGTATMAKALRLAGHAPAAADDLAHARVFGQPPGQYGTQILHLIPRGGVWDSRDEITAVYRENMSYVFTQGAWGERREGLYDAAITGTETIVRSWSSNMMSPLSNHHVYEYLGGLSMAVSAANGGKDPKAWIADVRDPNGVQMRDFREVLRMDYRTQLFNEKWIRGMMDNDYAGAGQIAELTKNTFGWSVTRPDDVDKYIWDEIAAIYVKDKYKLDLREWFEEENPFALQEMAATLVEAHRKGMWAADAETLAEVAKVYVESVAKHGASAGLVTGGNDALDEHLKGIYEAPGSQIPPAQVAAYRAQVAASRGARKAPRTAPPEPPADEAVVAGQRMETVDEAAASRPNDEAPRWWLAAGLGALFVGGAAARRLGRRREREKQ